MVRYGFKVTSAQMCQKIMSASTLIVNIYCSLNSCI